MQTRHPAELVVVDDGSSDRTTDILESFARSAPFLVVNKRCEVRRGPHTRFREAAAACRAEYIAWCDQDDVWHPSKLESCMAIVESTSDVALVLHSGNIVAADGGRTGRRVPDFRRFQILEPLRSNPRYSSPGFAQVFRRDLLSLAEGLACLSSPTNPHGIAHDELTHFLAFVCGRTVVLPDALVDWRRHGNNLSGFPRERHSRHSREGSSLIDDYEAQKRTADERARFLALAADRESAPRADRLRRGAAYYQRQSDLWHARCRIHSVERQRRVAALADLALRGGYRSRSRGGLGPQSAVRDIRAIAGR